MNQTGTISKVIYITCFFLFVFVAGCKHDQKGYKTTVIKYDVSNGIEENKKIYLSEIASDIETIPLETTDECIIGSIDDLKISSNYILVGDDQNNVLLFDIKGKFLRKIGHEGRGPAEYSIVADMLLSEKCNEVYILDRGKNYVLKYDLNNGKFVSSFKINFAPTKFTLLNDSTLLLGCTLPALIYSNNCMLYQVSTDFHKQESIQCFSSDYSNSVAKNTWGFVKLYSLNNNTYFWESNRDTIYSVSQSGNITPHCLFVTNNQYEVPDRVKNSDERYNELKGQYFKIDGFFETSNYFFLTGIQSRHGKHILLNKTDNSNYNVVFNYDIYDRGFHNDLDGGIPFWPEGQQSENVLYSSISPFKLNELMKNEYFKNLPVKLPEQQTKLLQLLKSSELTDNPLIFIVKLK